MAQIKLSFHVKLAPTFVGSGKYIKGAITLHDNTVIQVDQRVDNPDDLMNSNVKIFELHISTTQLPIVALLSIGVMSGQTFINQDENYIIRDQLGSHIDNIGVWIYNFQLQTAIQDPQYTQQYTQTATMVLIYKYRDEFNFTIQIDCDDMVQFGHRYHEMIVKQMKHELEYHDNVFLSQYLTSDIIQMFTKQNYEYLPKFYDKVLQKSKPYLAELVEVKWNQDSFLQEDSISQFPALFQRDSIIQSFRTALDNVRGYLFQNTEQGYIANNYGGPYFQEGSILRNIDSFGVPIYLIPATTEMLLRRTSDVLGIIQGKNVITPYVFNNVFNDAAVVLQYALINNYFFRAPTWGRALFNLGAYSIGNKGIGTVTKGAYNTLDDVLQPLIGSALALPFKDYPQTDSIFQTYGRIFAQKGVHVLTSALTASITYFGGKMILSQLPVSTMLVSALQTMHTSHMLQYLPDIIKYAMEPSRYDYLEMLESGLKASKGIIWQPYGSIETNDFKIGSPLFKTISELTKADILKNPQILKGIFKEFTDNGNKLSHFTELLEGTGFDLRYQWQEMTEVDNIIAYTQSRMRNPNNRLGAQGVLKVLNQLTDSQSRTDSYLHEVFDSIGPSTKKRIIDSVYTVQPNLIDQMASSFDNFQPYSPLFKFASIALQTAAVLGAGYLGKQVYDIMSNKYQQSKNISVNNNTSQINNDIIKPLSTTRYSQYADADDQHKQRDASDYVSSIAQRIATSLVSKWDFTRELTSFMMNIPTMRRPAVRKRDQKNDDKQPISKAEKKHILTYMYDYIADNPTVFKIGVASAGLALGIGAGYAYSSKQSASDNTEVVDKFQQAYDRTVIHQNTLSHRRLGRNRNIKSKRQRLVKLIRKFEDQQENEKSQNIWKPTQKKRQLAFHDNKLLGKRHV